MIGFSFLASRLMIEKAMNNVMQDLASDNLTKEEQKILDSLNNQLLVSKISSSKQCPTCHKHFYVLRLNNVEIDCCKRCESLWFDPEELKIVMNTPNDIVDEALHAGKSKYNCPVCEVKLQKRSFLFPERLVVDKCPEGHGVYFEKGELEKIFKIRK